MVIAYCHLGNELEQLYADEDKNAFIVSFRMTDDEIMNTISIRISTVEFFDSCVFEGGNIDTKLVQQVLESLG